MLAALGPRLSRVADAGPPAPSTPGSPGCGPRTKAGSIPSPWSRRCWPASTRRRPRHLDRRRTVEALRRSAGALVPSAARGPAAVGRSRSGSRTTSTWPTARRPVACPASPTWRPDGDRGRPAAGRRRALHRQDQPRPAGHGAGRHPVALRHAAVNPLDPTYIPGGSSSGSAVAVARGQVGFALGTDTAGSGRVPAALCGVVGIKGAPGSCPMDGVQPASPTIDCVSTFARSVADGLVVDRVLGGRPWPVARGPFTVAVAGVARRGRRPPGRGPRGGRRWTSRRSTRPATSCTAAPGWPTARRRCSRCSTASPEGVDEIVRKVIAPAAAIRGTTCSRPVARREHPGRARRRGGTPWTCSWCRPWSTCPRSPRWRPTRSARTPASGRNTTFANLLGLTAVAVPAAAGPGGVTVLGPPGHAGAVVGGRRGDHRRGAADGGARQRSGGTTWPSSAPTSGASR